MSKACTHFPCGLCSQITLFIDCFLRTKFDCTFFTISFRISELEEHEGNNKRLKLMVAQKDDRINYLEQRYQPNNCDYIYKFCFDAE